MTTPLLPCSVCQRGPARVFSIRRHVGMVLLQRFVKLRVPLCRDHVLEITKSYLGKTLWQGWWGYISLFVNVFVVVSDLVVLVQARGMEQPRELPPGYVPPYDPSTDAQQQPWGGQPQGQPWGGQPQQPWGGQPQGQPPYAPSPQGQAPQGQQPDARAWGAPPA